MHIILNKGNRWKEMSNTANQNNTDRIPKEFQVEEIENDLPYENVVILKWKKQIDDRPLYVESALILSDYNINYRNGYALIHIYRHPLRSYRQPASWEISLVCDADQTPLESFEHRPTKKDLMQFEQNTWWENNTSSDFKLIDSNICMNNINQYLASEEDELVLNDEINELIKIGKNYSNKNIEYIKTHIKDIKLNFNESIQYDLHTYFREDRRGYSKSDLSYIIIGVIVGEAYLRNGEQGSENGYGSVTATQNIIRILEREDPLRAKVMKRWAQQFGFINSLFYN